MVASESTLVIGDANDHVPGHKDKPLMYSTHSASNARTVTELSFDNVHSCLCEVLLLPSTFLSATLHLHSRSHRNV